MFSFHPVAMIRFQIFAAIIVATGIPFSAECDPDDSAVHDRLFHVELRGGIAPPIVAGYWLHAEGDAGIQFRKLLAADVRVSRVMFSLPGPGKSGLLVSADMGVLFIASDRRRHQKGWISRVGPMLGYAIFTGQNLLDEGEGECDMRVQYLTAGLVYKTIHWWNRYIGFVLEIQAMGGVSFHLYRTVYWKDDRPPDPYVEINRFKWAEDGTYGVRVTCGVAF